MWGGTRGGRVGPAGRGLALGQPVDHGCTGIEAIKAILSPWPVHRPVDWTDRVNASLGAQEPPANSAEDVGAALTARINWVKRTASELGSQHTVRPEGRPPKRNEPVA